MSRSHYKCDNIEAELNRFLVSINKQLQRLPERNDASNSLLNLYDTYSLSIPESTAQEGILDSMAKAPNAFVRHSFVVAVPEIKSHMSNTTANTRGETDECPPLPSPPPPHRPSSSSSSSTPIHRWGRESITFGDHATTENYGRRSDSCSSGSHSDAVRTPHPPTAQYLDGQEDADEQQIPFALTVPLEPKNTTSTADGLQHFEVTNPRCSSMQRRQELVTRENRFAEVMRTQTILFDVTDSIRSLVGNFCKSIQFIAVEEGDENDIWAESTIGDQAANAMEDVEPKPQLRAHHARMSCSSTSSSHSGDDAQRARYSDHTRHLDAQGQEEFLLTSGVLETARLEVDGFSRTYPISSQVAPNEVSYEHSDIEPIPTIAVISTPQSSSPKAKAFDGTRSRLSTVSFHSGHTHTEVSASALGHRTNIEQSYSTASTTSQLNGCSNSNVGESSPPLTTERGGRTPTGTANTSQHAERVSNNSASGSAANSVASQSLHTLSNGDPALCVVSFGSSKTPGSFEPLQLTDMCLERMYAEMPWLLTDHQHQRKSLSSRTESSQPDGSASTHRQSSSSSSQSMPSV